MNNSTNSGPSASMEATSSASIDQNLYIQWPIPLWLILLLIVGIGAFAFWLYQSERGNSRQKVRWTLTVLRSSLLLMVLWMLMGWSWQRAKIELPELVIAVDVSESMLTTDEVDVSDANTPCNRLHRAQQALNLTDQKLQELQDRYRLKIALVAEDVQILDLSPVEVVKKLANFKGLLEQIADSKFTEHSRLGDSMIRTIEGQSGRGTAAIVFLSDGISTSGRTLKEAGQRARRSAIPIHTICLGRQFAQPDLRVGDILVEPQVHLGDQVSLEVTLLAKDLAVGAATKVQLVEIDTSSLLDEQSIEIQPGDSQTNVTLRFEPKQPGQKALQVVVQPLPQENDNGNNKSQVQLLVQDRAIRVLMVFGQPSYEFRYLKHFLERTKQSGPDKPDSFELTSILQSGDPSYAQQDSAARRFVSSDPAELSEFDTFIFGPLDASTITRSSQQAIVRAVTHGGAGCIFLASGSDPVRQLARYPLGDLLPIEKVTLEADNHASFEMETTKSGQSVLPITLRNTPKRSFTRSDFLTPLQSVLRVETVKPGAQILAHAISNSDGRRNPLIVAQFAGAGRTCFLATDETYRWTTAYGSDQTHQRFWGQLLRWVSRGKLNSINETELKIEPKQAQEGKPIRFQLRLPLGQTLPNEAEIKLDGPMSAGPMPVERTVKLQRLVERGALYEGVVEQLTSGDYRALVTQPALATPPAVEFSVTAPPTEQAELRADQESMKQLAEISQGRAYLAGDAARWQDNLPRGEAIQLGSLPSQPLWNQHWVAALFVGLLTAEWLLRRHARML